MALYSPRPSRSTTSTGWMRCWNGRPGSVARELKTVVISENGRDWRPLATEALPTDRVRLTVEMPGPRLDVARLEPYRISDLDRLLAELKKLV